MKKPLKNATFLSIFFLCEIFSITTPKLMNSAFANIHTAGRPPQTAPAPHTFNTWLSGKGAPSNNLGNNGDFYLDLQNIYFYGPKSNGHWPISGVALKGTAGPTGLTGISGKMVRLDLPVQLDRSEEHTSELQSH